MQDFKSVLLMVSLSIVFGSCIAEDAEPQSEFVEFIYGNMNYQGNERKYILHIPESYSEQQETPLVVFLHGGGGNTESAQSFSNFNEVSDKEGFLIVYPQAFFESAPNNFVWADGRGLAPDKMGIDDVGFINELVSLLKSEYNVDHERVYLCGFSNGSFLTQKIAFEKNDQFAAIGTLGGTMNESLYNEGNPGRAIPMIYVFGTDDPLVPYEGGFVSGNTELAPVVGVEDAVQFWKENNKCLSGKPGIELPDLENSDHSTVEIFEYIDCECGADVKFYKIQGGGHTWPGVKLPNQTSLGETNLDIQASAELWNFFNGFTLCK